MQHSDLLDIGAVSKKFAETVLEYTLVEFKSVQIYPTGEIKFWFFLEDDFCCPYEQADYGMQTITFEAGERIPPNLFFNYPNRENRELQVLIRETKKLTHLSDKLESLEARAFVAELIQSSERYYAALEDKSIEAAFQTEQDGAA